MPGKEKAVIVVALAVAGLAAGYVWLLRYTDEQRERVLDSILASHEAPNDSGLVSPATTASPVSASPSQTPVPAEPNLEEIGKMLWEDRTAPLSLLNVPCFAEEDTTGEMAQYLAKFHAKYDAKISAVREWVLRDELTCLDIPPRAPDGPRRRLSRVQAGVDCLRRDCDAALAEHNHAQAVQDMLAILKLERMVAEAGALEHIVFLFTVPNGIGTPLKHLMHRDALSEQELGVLAEALAALADPALLTQALERERLWQAQGLSGWPERSLADSVKLAGWWVGGRSWLWTRPPCRPLFNHDVTTFMGYMDKIVPLAQPPFWEHLETLSRLGQELYALPPIYSASQRLGTLCGSIGMFYRVAAKIEVLSLALRTAQFQRVHGRVPTSLEELHQAYPTLSITDLYTGNPYSFSPTPEGACEFRSAGLDGELDTEDDLASAWPTPSPCTEPLPSFSEIVL